jgi:hypothetical protein
MNPGPPRIVEFFGLPGSGKTTIARELHDRMRAVDPGVVYGPRVTSDHKSGLPRAVARVLLIVGGFPWRRADWPALRAMATTRQRTRRDQAKVLFNYLTVASLFRRLARTGRGAVVDQGVLQAIWSANLRGVEPFSPERWCPLLLSESRSDKVHVFVQTPVAICKERLSFRPEKHSRMQSPGLLGDAERWEQSELVCARLVNGLTSCLRSQGSSSRVMIVDGTRDPGELAEGILAKVLDAGSPLVDARDAPCRARRPSDPSPHSS